MDLFNDAPAYFDEDDRYFNEDSTRDDDPPVMQALYQMAERIAALPTVRIANPQRMRQVMAVKAALEQLQIENGEQPSVELHDHAPFFPHSCGISLRSEYLEAMEPARFVPILQLADHIEIFPLTGSRFEISMVFRHVYEVQVLDKEDTSSAAT